MMHCTSGRNRTPVAVRCLCFYVATTLLLSVYLSTVSPSNHTHVWNYFKFESVDSRVGSKLTLSGTYLRNMEVHASSSKKQRGTDRRTIILALLLLSGIEQNPGPINASSGSTSSSAKRKFKCVQYLTSLMSERCRELVTYTYELIKLNSIYSRQGQLMLVSFVVQPENTRN